MEIEVYQKCSKLTFGDLKPGDTYRTENGDSIYMKVKNALVFGEVDGKYHAAKVKMKANTVAIETGNMFKHNDYYKVYRVSGKFVEGKPQQ